MEDAGLLPSITEAGIESDVIIGVAMKVLESALIIIGALLAILFIRGLSRRLLAARILDEANVSSFYRLARDVILISSTLVILYILTGSRFVILVIAILLAALLLATWDLLMNIASYYAIIITRIVSRGEYIVLPNGVRGIVRDVKPLFTTVETKYGVYSVPNTVFVRFGVMSKRETSYYRLTLRVWGLPSTQLIENVRNAVDSVIESFVPREDKAVAMHRLVIDEVSEDSVTVRLIVSMPHTEPKPEKLAPLIESLSRRLQEHGINHSITVEEPEGYEQRWGATLG
ncbi:MAG: mechanosensitive ion channel [Aeropyrum sp.]|nr:mechanosensitive ion channel [Aeropyrum sp.]